MILDALRGTGDSGNSDYMNADKAVTYSAVKFCVDKISSHIGQMPLNLHKITKDRNEKNTRHDGYRLMRVRPNAYQTPFMFKRQMMTHCLLWGNGRAYIWRNGSDVELIPMMPDRCESVLIDGEKVHIYLVRRDERLSLSKDIAAELRKAKKENRQPDVVALDDKDVLHWHGIGFDGVQGKSVIQMARQSWNLGLGHETTERNRQKKGYSGGLMLEAPVGMFRKDDEAKQFLSDFRAAQGGENADVIGMLREGMKANILNMSNADAQFIEGRKLQREEVMLWFGMPTMPGDDASQSYNSLEQKNLSYRIDCLGPWLTIIEEECEAKLLTQAEVRNGYYFKFNDGAILRTDKQTTANIASTLITARVINPNEAREWFELNPYNGGELFENPAVSPGQPGSTSESTDKPDEQMGSNPKNASARQSVVEHMIGVEANRCIQACRSDNFCDKIDRFYAKWETTLANKLEQIGIDRDFASDHCDESKEAMFAIAGKASDAESLRAMVVSEVDGWKQRAFTMIQEVEALKC